MTRRKKVVLALGGALAIAALAVFAWPRRPYPGPVPSDRSIPPLAAAESAALVRHVSVLSADSMEGRLVDTEGSARARRYIAQQFAAAGLEPIEMYERKFALPGADSSRLRGDTTGYVPPHGTNVMGRILGLRVPDRYIVITAHYDGLGVKDGQVYNGADDNASGVAALPVLAAWFARNPPAHSIVFVALDSEEDGLLGAKELVRRPPVRGASIAINVNLDMIGRNEKGELFVAGTHYQPRLLPLLRGVARGALVKVRFGHDRPTLNPSDDWTESSDHAAFHEKGIPWLYFGVEDHPDYHQPTDDAERVDPKFHADAVATIRAMVVALDRALSGQVELPGPQDGKKGD